MKSTVTFSELARGTAAAIQDLTQVGKVSAASVLKHTGKDWKQWVTVLDQAGARAWSYQELVAHLTRRHQLTPWWRHGVAMGFEIATGRRRAGQDVKGKYMVTATKSVPFGVKELWSFLVSPEGQEAWLKPLAGIDIEAKRQFETSDGFFGEIRTVARNRRARMFWQEPAWEKHTVLELMLVARPGKKSILVFNHTGIRDPRTKDLLRARWRKAVDEILDRMMATRQSAVVRSRRLK